MIFLDTNIIIYLSKELVNIDDIIEDNEEYAISVISYMEIFGYNFQSKKEEEFIKNFLTYFKIVHIDNNIVKKVIEIRKTHKIKLPDAIIVATCIVNNSKLITNDIRLKNIKELNLKLVDIEYE